MDIEERLRALEDEFPAAKDELKRILVDIRTFIMETDTPLRTDSTAGYTPSETSPEERVE